MKTAIIESPKFKHIRSQIEEEDNIDLVMHYLDDTKVNLFRFLQLIMLDYAWDQCSEGVNLPPNRIQCAF